MDMAGKFLFTERLLVRWTADLDKKIAKIFAN